MNAGPILCKIKEAAGFIARSQAAGQHALSERSVRLEGAEGCFLHVDYDQATAGIILAFVGNGRYELVERDTLAGRETPPWAPNNDVKCHARLLAYFASFVLPEQSDHPSLLETMLFLSKVRSAAQGLHVWLPAQCHTAHLFCSTILSDRTSMPQVSAARG